MPSPLPFETTLVRRSIIASYWLIALLAVGVWWATTSIERLSLPESEIHSLASRTLRLPVQISLDPEWAPQSVSDFERELKQATTNSRLDVQTLTSLPTDISYEVIKSSLSSGCEVNKRTLSCPSSYSAAQIASNTALLLNPFPDSFSQHLVVRHAPRYRLAFSLLNEDATVGGAIEGWDVGGLVAQHISPTLSRLSSLHNFTIESQVRYHAPLAFAPQSLESAGKPVYGLTPADLTVFINSAEWSLSSSVSDDPVLHFVAFVPSSERRPLRLLDTLGQPTSFNSFVIPQWGGIIVVNPQTDEHTSSDHVLAAFHTFSSQLASLLGVHPLPDGIVNNDPNSFISDWQLDSLMRRRLLETSSATQETLSSIVKLVNQLENMPLGPDVKNSVQDSLNLINDVFTESDSSLEQAVAKSIKSSTLSSQAFFNPGMLALLYFPMEHIWVVYAPLFAPVSLPLVAAAVRELKKWRIERNALG